MKLPGSLLFDALGLAGALLVCTGLWWIYPPVALIVAGAACLTVAVLGTYRR